MSPSQSPFRVILADEHHLFRAGLVGLLRTQGIHTLAETHSAERTIDLVSRLEPHLVIVSLTLADQPGLEVIHALRKRDPHLPLLALSASYSQLALHSALRAGASALVSKTHDIHQLVQSIQILVERPRPGLRLQRSNERYISLRQVRILRALTSGRTNDQIAHHLSFSRSTIKAELRQLFDTFATEDRNELISRAAHHGLIGAGSG